MHRDSTAGPCSTKPRASVSFNGLLYSITFVFGPHYVRVLLNCFGTILKWWWIFSKQHVQTSKSQSSCSQQIWICHSFKQTANVLAHPCKITHWIYLADQKWLSCLSVKKLHSPKHVSNLSLCKSSHAKYSIRQNLSLVSNPNVSACCNGCCFWSNHNRTLQEMVFSGVMSMGICSQTERSNRTSTEVESLVYVALEIYCFTVLGCKIFCFLYWCVFVLHCAV